MNHCEDGMTLQPVTISQEVAALVHNVELNRSGWWSKTVQRLILAIAWMSARPVSVKDIQKELRENFHLRISEDKIEAATKVLESQGLLSRLHGSGFRIPDSRRNEFNTEIADAEKTAATARGHFSELTKIDLGELDANAIWGAFEGTFLTPLIREVGANASRLVAGEQIEIDKRIVQRFLEQFDPRFHVSLKNLAKEFLNPQNGDIRKYIGRLLHASFCVEAIGLSEDVITKINESRGRKIEFRIFLDTNLLFSILGIHDNPQNAAVKELQDVIATLKTSPRISLFVTNRTLDEAKRAIGAVRAQLIGIPTGNNFAEAGLRIQLSGMATRFFEERLLRGGNLSAEDWFDPYLSNIVTIARTNGIELFNEKLDQFSTRQDVVDDINVLLEAEGRRTGKTKNYEMIEHDMILWHFVNENRGAYIESPIDARDWILTIDSRLVAFDQHKRRKQSKSMVPLCLQPSSLLQLLQFWVPRTREFEEAVLGSLSLPFLFREFDTESERISFRILNGIGRFNNVSHLSQSAIVDIVLDDNLRNRIVDERNNEAEQNLIRDALLEAEKARAEKILEDLQQRIASESKNKDLAIEDLKLRLAREEEKVQKAESRLTSQDLEIERIKRQLDEQNRAEAARLHHTIYAALVLTAIIFSGGAGLLLSGWLTNLAFLFGRNKIAILSGVLTFIALHLVLEKTIGRKESMKGLWPFRRISALRAWLWSFVITGFVAGVIGNLIANDVQQQRDSQQAAPHAEKAK